MGKMLILLHRLSFICAKVRIFFVYSIMIVEIF